MLKKFIAAITAAAALTTSLIIPVNAADTSEYELQTQYTFESSTEGWSGRASENLEVSTKWAQSGSSSLYISNRTSYWNGAAMYNTLEPGGTYYISAYVLYDNSSYSSQSFQLSLQYDSAGSPQYPAIATKTAYNCSWLELSGEVTIPTDAENISFYVQTAYTTNPTDQDLMPFYLDNVSVYTLPSPEIQWDIKSLKKCFSEYFTVGTAIMSSQCGIQANDDLVNKHFNSITFGNELKPDYTLDKSASLAYYQQTGDQTNPQVKIDDARVLLEYCKKYDIPVRGHVLVWHSQTPDWFFKEGYSDSGNWVSEEVMIARMENYIKNLMELLATEYPTVEFYAWDVVNEAFLDNGSHRVAGSNNVTNETSAWVSVFGDNSFIEYAFKFARQYAPEGCKLYYNDYNEYEAGKQAAIIETCTDLYEKGLIDGIGLQSHLDIGYPTISNYKKSLLAYCQTGLDIQITELDITMSSYSEANLQTQADYYGQIFDYAVELVNQGYNISAVVLWGLIDTDSWRASKYPLIFDDKWQAKEAYYAIVDSYEEVEESEIIYGDANGDGIVNSIDATMVTRHALKVINLSDDVLACCDVNGDGTVNSIDATIITRYALKVITSLPV
ncbi:MAG: endo-1,4-beta-xylanase [Oscillospiraceae bacterium]|nr:endo-1,4-beta-xylanase [Oscillospiraceae bacterium]